MLLSVFLYWWQVRPAIIAQRFTRAVEEKNFVAADALLTGKTQLNLDAESKASRTISMTTVFDKPTAADWVTGRRTGRFELSATLVKGGIDRTGELVATATGISVSRQSETYCDSPPEVPYGPVSADDNWQSATTPVLPIQR